ncbi:MAG: ATP-binding protein [Planctomycetia bacterium]|nr:ATP-binding protein [Planctomycetia bacterium]
MKDEMYFLFFQQGMQSLKEGNTDVARILLLKSAKLQYKRAKTVSEIQERQKCIQRAERILAITNQLPQGGATPSGTISASKSIPISNYHANSGINSGNVAGNQNGNGENGEESSRWQMTTIPDVTFADIAGLDSVKQLITQRVIFPLKHPEIAKVYNRRAGAGIMMYGPPGTGKTMMAKAIAGELKLPFFSVQSSSIMSKWVGDAEQNLRDLFKEAREKAPSVLFFDEAEALLCKRGGENSGVMNRVIPEFLAQVDGISKSAEGLLLVGATNRPWDLDPAAVRTGRFGEKIYIPLPDAPAREFLLRQKLAELPGAESFDFSELAQRTEGFSGADINGLIYHIIDPVFARAVETGREMPILMSDVETALKHARPSVTEADLAEFEKYQQELEN